ncbi:MAG: chemotaxis protein CheD [candidate division FCPU426 bacterium]
MNSILGSQREHIVIGVADMKLSNQRGDILVTHALGSCLGIAIHDPVACVGGIFHVMLPTSSASPEKAASHPLMFVDTGTPLFFKQAYALGASKPQLVVKVAGGSALALGDDFFAIGKRNILMLRKLLWKNDILIAKEDVGGSISRTLYLEVGTGKTWLHSSGQEWEL